MAFADLGEQAVKRTSRGGRRVRADLQGRRGDSGRLDPVVGGRRGGVVGRPVRAGNPLLLRRRRAAGLCPYGGLPLVKTGQSLLKINHLGGRLSGFRYLPSVITAPIETKLAPFNQNIWLAGVETIRSTIPEGTPKSFAIRPIASVALIDI